MRRSRTLDDVPDPLWRLVSLAAHRLLMLDFDGTLAPFTVARDEARPLPRSRELAARIAEATHTDLAIVSGRPVGEIERLLGPLPATLVGDHGWERREPGRKLMRHPLPPGTVAALDRAERLARDAGCGEQIERKRPALVLHTRGLAPARAREMEARCADAWEPLVAAGRVRMDRINGGLELRARGRDKGAVVRSLMSRAPAGTLAVFVGDDVTDEDAFEAVRDHGFGVRVGDAARPTMAMALLPSVEAVADFLSEWLVVATPAEGAS